MKTFCVFIFWLYLMIFLARVTNTVTGSYNKPATIGIYCADTVLTATIMIWAGFALWW